ncbi:ImmA/IrrE family metallo-endopeptidase [Acetobacterium wieringae]|uniref:ImmA/IrrE family metallo-endopeptidase n=1 Tax=Acetobacterium wieringae TaxID=52694 RepID=A0A5D0WIS7_9FIRM|nr:ImmA/IrrE family metallo-endopeptidase [Acetobacterium wieringae]TYC84185.1 ImmA/IrrE family metallo-endopeptidase [Acetobacterium wieringae]
MGEQMTYINPDILVWARRVSGLDYDEIESTFDIQKIECWEKGTEFPTYAQLTTLSKLYKKPIAVFFFPEPPEYTKIAASFRTLPELFVKMFSSNRIKIINTARVMQLNLYELNDGINPTKNLITNIKFKSKSINELAKELRGIMNRSLDEQIMLRKSDEAFEFWRDAFFDLGIYVFKEAFKDDAISGFCLYDEIFPVIYINNSLAINRQIFTLFHEIYHIINQTSGVDLINDDSIFNCYKNLSDKQIEINCNEFAGVFLVPDNDFLKVIQKIGYNEEVVEKLANRYSVSREVILRKYLNHGIINQEEYLNKQKDFNDDYLRYKDISKKSAKKSSGNYYNTQVAYKGIHYVALTLNKYYTQKISVTQLAQYLDMKISSIDTLTRKKGWGKI